MFTRVRRRIGDCELAEHTVPDQSTSGIVKPSLKMAFLQEWQLRGSGHVPKAAALLRVGEREISRS